jgi:YbbR domain-containing protein
MTEGVKQDVVRPTFPRSRALGTTAKTASRQFDWLWSRESMLRLGLGLVLAVVLWLYVTSKENPTIIDYNQPLPVAISQIGDQFTVTNGLGSVKIRLRVGSGSQIITTANFHASVNLFGMRPGSYRAVPVDVISTDPGIKVVSIIPSHIPVLIEQKLTKQVPVLAHVVTSVPDGYVMGKPQFSPSVVSVSGPRSLVSQVTQASVDVYLSGVRTSLEGPPQPPTLLDNQSNQIIGAKQLLVVPQDVQVTVPVRQLNSFKTIPLLVPIKGQPKPGFGVAGISVQPAEITANGPPSVLNRLSKAYTDSVSVAGRGAGTVVAHTSISLPRGVSSSDRRVTVRIQLAAVEVSTSIQVGVSPTGVLTGLVARTTPASVLVTVIGPSSQLARAARRMSATVNVAGFAAGIYYLQPTVVAPRGLTVGEVSPVRVSVSLQVAPTK